MEIETLKRIVQSQRELLDEKFGKENIVEREGEANIKNFLKYPNILAILGVRRSGKSILSILLSRKLSPTGYINFADERMLTAKTEDLDKVLQAFYELYGDIDTIILDEAQNVDGWEMFASRLRTAKKVIVTGSNSKLLSGELATHLTGRHIDFTLYPFSFREILEFTPNIYSAKDTAKIRLALKEYANGSGFPEFRLFGRVIVSEIYNDIITKDCLRRHKIREEKSFRELAAYLVSNFSSEFTYSKLSKVTGLKDVHTTKNYVGYLEEAYVIVVLERYSPKLKQQFIAPKKAYCIDQGFCNFVSFKISENTGKIYENVVAVELMRQKSLNKELEVFYYRSLQDYEVDFVLKNATKVMQLIQVCYGISGSNTKEREVKSLIHASEEMKCQNLLIITDNYEAEETHSGKKIKFVPLWRWLLEHGAGKALPIRKGAGGSGKGV